MTPTERASRHLVAQLCRHPYCRLCPSRRLARVCLIAGIIIGVVSVAALVKEAAR